MGNSGGALVNTKGELIGINTAISSISGGFVGYSFAVPSNTVRKVFEDIIEYGNVQKGLLGVQGNALNADLAEKFEISDTEGFYIGDVERGLGADLAGLKKGDIIKKVDGTKINKFSDLTGYLSTKRPGDKVKVFYKSDGKSKEALVTLKKTNRIRFIGMELKNLSEDEKTNFKIKKGVVISKMLNSRLYNYGIEKGFVVLEVNDILIDEVATIESITLESLSSILFLSPEGQKERILFE
jgi:S1-C subfamily serine protease